MTLTLTAYAKRHLSVIRLPPATPLPESLLASLRDARPLAAVTFTPDETSLVLPEASTHLLGAAAASAKIERGWKAFKVEGPLDFALVGVLSQLSGLLAAADVSLFAVSTFDTDYLLVKEHKFEAAAAALAAGGCAVHVVD